MTPDQLRAVEDLCRSAEQMLQDYNGLMQTLTDHDMDGVRMMDSPAAEKMHETFRVLCRYIFNARRECLGVRQPTKTTGAPLVEDRSVPQQEKPTT